ncbi:MAG: DHH family phosphoesterase [Spirochaetales bacterium]|nr:DHH family phosphoesterase [Spirochaetales bacterium]
MQGLRFTEDIIIMGNQAADLDSCVSAFAFASLLTALNPEIKIHPLIQGSFEDLRLKPEIESLFRRAGISLRPDHFTAHFPPAPLKGSRNRALILVDHNRVDSPELTYRPVGIVDHHRDTGAYPGLSLRDIRICGSCSAIISEYWRESGLPLSRGNALLLAGAIAVDTGYLDPSWGKATELDRKEYTRLLGQLSPEDQDYLKTLLHVKNDLSHLNLMEHLKRDYKDFPVIGLRGGIASITLGQDEFFSPDFFRQEVIQEFIQKTCPDFLIIMHTVPEPFKRELSVFVPDQKGYAGKEIRQGLEKLKEPGLSINNTKQNGYGGVWTLYSQKNIKVSRKVLTPLLKEVLEK